MLVGEEKFVVDKFICLAKCEISKPLQLSSLCVTAIFLMADVNFYNMSLQFNRAE